MRRGIHEMNGDWDGMGWDGAHGMGRGVGGARAGQRDRDGLGGNESKRCARNVEGRGNITHGLRGERAGA